jgi:hypothetical protein
VSDQEVKYESNGFGKVGCFRLGFDALYFIFDHTT